MASIAAIPIKEVLGSETTDDGKHALVKTRHADGTEVTLAVPRDELFKFIDCFALWAGQARSKAGVPKEVKQVFETSWFDLGGDATGSVVLSLTFGAGGTLSFRMPRSMAEQIRETLSVHLGHATSQTPSTPRH
jgi:hypothetical protein